MEEDNNPPSPIQPEQIASIPAKKAFTLPMVILLILVVALFVGATVFLLTKKAKSPPLSTPLSPTSANPTATPMPSPVEWKTYTNSQAGFSLKYPDSVLLNAETKGASQSVLLINVEKLSSIPEDLPQRMGRTDALKEKDRLAKGEGENIVKLGSLNGRAAMTLAQFEICSVILTRSLTFFPGEYRVTILLVGVKNAIMTSMPYFFTVDNANCGTERIWNQDKITTFEPTLAQKKGQGAGQEWYDTFDAIVKTVTLTTPNNTVSSDLSTYKNDQYGFEIFYPKPYRALDDAASLSGYPKGVVLLYTGGQAYDVVIEVWNTQSEYESSYSSRMSDVTVVKSKDKFITLFNNTKEPENEKIIATFKLLQQ